MFKYLGFTEEQAKEQVLNGCISVWSTTRTSFGLDRLVAILGGRKPYVILSPKITQID
jgi:hypothetical protein